MEDENTEPTEAPEPIYHHDPAVNVGLRKLEERAAYYALAHAILTGKFDQNFSQWKAAQSIDEKDTDPLPDLTNVQEWMFTTASINGLLLFQRKLNDLMTVLVAELFGRYAQKNVRGQVPADTDLSELRAGLVKILNAHVAMIDAGMIDTMTVEMICSLPTMRKFAKENGSPSPRRADGTWIIPNAPADKSAEVKVTNTGALRSHNTNVKFVRDGVLQEHATLGQACAALFNVEKPADMASTFDNWSPDFFAIGDEEPKKAVVRDGHKYWLTKVG